MEQFEAFVIDEVNILLWKNDDWLLQVVQNGVKFFLLFDSILKCINDVVLHLVEGVFRRSKENEHTNKHDHHYYNNVFGLCLIKEAQGVYKS